MRGRLVGLVAALIGIGAVSAGAAGAAVGVGYDVSYPQCGQPLPAGGAFAIVGVNAGLPFGPNPCLAAELAWAGAGAQLYANTADPGPSVSAHWPAGQASPQPCPATADDTAACAYDYGWNAAQDAHADAAAAANGAWWLDVERANSWETTVANNVAAIQGAVDYLHSVGVAALGIYGTQADWTAITGGSTAFAALPFWLAGASSQDDAAARCSLPAPNGGRLALVQFPGPGAGADVDCSTVPVLSLAVPPLALLAGRPLGPLVVRLPAAAAAPVAVSLATSSSGGGFATSASGPWTPTLTVTVAAGAVQAPPVWYRDTTAGTAALTASAPGYAAGRAQQAVSAPPCVPPRPGRGFELVLARRTTKAAAAATAHRLRVSVNGKRARLAVERDGCRGWRVAVHGFATRAAAARALRTLRPRIQGATVGRS